MKQLLVPAAAMLVGIAMPAASKPWHGHGYGHEHGQGYGLGNCPPGLRDKGCMPPGQAKKMFRRGERYDLGYGRRYSTGQIPHRLRREYDLTNRYHYYYDNGYLYQVDPRTLIVEQVIRALLR